MKAKKQRKIENQPDDYLYKENQREVTFTEFVKLELILFLFTPYTVRFRVLWTD